MLPIGPDTPVAEVLDAVERWLHEAVPEPWRRAADSGGPGALRQARTRQEYEAWYPVYGASGLVVPTWPPEYGGLGLPARVARPIEARLAHYRLGRLNPLGLNLAAPAL